MAGPPDETPTCSRRQLLRASAGAAGAGAALYGGNRANLVGTAQADNWQIVKDALTATSGYAYAYDYMMGTDYTEEATTRLANYAHQRFGDMRNYDGYTGGSALHTEAVIGFTEMKVASEQIMTGISNQIEMSDNVGYSKGKVALIESLNSGDDVTTAKDKMNTALNDYYTSIQKAVIQHYKQEVSQMRHIFKRLADHEEVEFGDNVSSASSVVATIFQTRNSYGESNDPDAGVTSDEAPYVWMTGRDSQNITYGDQNYEEGTFIYINGDEETGVPVGLDSDWWFLPDANAENYSGIASSRLDGKADGVAESATVGIANEGQIFSNLGNETWSSYESDGIIAFDSLQYQEAMESLYTARDRVNADLQGFADDLYAEYQSGDISLAEVVDPITYATEISQDNNPDAFREASAAQLGIPSDAAFNTTIEVFTEDGDGNEVSSQFETELFTAHTPTDADGNAVDWQVGTRYSPSSWSDPLFITYPADDSGNRDMTQLEKDFKIVGAIDQDGNSIDSFGSRQTNVQTADITKLQQDLDRLRDAQAQLLEEQNTSDDGGGGGSTSDTNPLMQKVYGIPVVGYILGIGGGAYLYSERNSDDDRDRRRRGGGRY